MRLEESGPKRQTELAEELGIEAYAMSRLLSELELHQYVTRRRKGTDKLASLKTKSSAGAAYKTTYSRTEDQDPNPRCTSLSSVNSPKT